MCTAHPEACYDYCDYFPDECESFRKEFPDFARPESVNDFADFVTGMKSLGYYALFAGDTAKLETWPDRVKNYCAKYSDNKWCNFL